MEDFEGIKTAIGVLLGSGGRRYLSPDGEREYRGLTKFSSFHVPQLAGVDDSAKIINIARMRLADYRITGSDQKARL